MFEFLISLFMYIFTLGVMVFTLIRWNIPKRWKDFKFDDYDNVTWILTSCIFSMIFLYTTLSIGHKVL